MEGTRPETDRREEVPAPGAPAGLVDAHCHLPASAADGAGAALAAARRAGVRAVAVWGTEPGDWIRPDPGAVPAGLVVRQGFGLHPWKLSGPLPAGWKERLEEELRNDPALGVGETGLDFRPGMAGRALQLEVLRVHWGLARKHDRPLSLHAVRAHGALLPLMREWGAVRAQVHGFEGSPELAPALCREGFFLSMGRGLLRPTRPDSFARALLAAVPRGRAMFETDSDGPAGLRAVVEGIASRSGIPFGELADDGARSARAFLGF